MEKNGVKRDVLVDEYGLPLSIVVCGADTHDVTMLEKMLDAKIKEAPDEQVGNLCLDAGYTGMFHKKTVEIKGYIPHIRSRGEEKKTFSER